MYCKMVTAVSLVTVHITYTTPVTIFFLWLEILRSTPCCCSVAQSFSTLQPPGLQHCQALLSFTISWILLRLMSIESVIPCNHLILCHPLLLLPWIFPSIKVFSNESSLHIRRLKYWSFSFSINPSNEYSWLTSFRVDWFDHPAVQGTLKSLLWHHNSKHQFFGTQRLPYGSILTSGHVYWSSCSSDYTKICQQSDGSAF